MKLRQDIAAGRKYGITMAEARSNHRFARLLKGSLAFPHEAQHDVLIYNISEHGVGVKYAGQVPAIGTSVEISIPVLGHFHGTLRWHANNRIGIQLIETLKPEQIQFDGGELHTRDEHKYKVASRFQPVTTTYRPGFGKR